MAERITPTDEQIGAREKFLDGRNLKINAYAGTGKTETLRVLAEASKGSSLYLAFNRDIVSASQGKFPERVTRKTTHAVARDYVRGRWPYSDTKLNGVAKPREIAEFLSLPQHTEFHIPFVRPLGATQLARVVRGTISKFLNSSDSTVNASHIPIEDVVGSRLYLPSLEKQGEIANVVLPWAMTLWDLMCKTNSPMPLSQNGYFKLWTLQDIQLPFDCIYLDEAQDSNPPLLDLLRRQKAQLVYVGDPYQAIYSWRGAVNAMTEVSTPNEAALTTCFRFGQSIADAAFKVIETLGARNPLRGNPHIFSLVSSVAQPDCIITRTNLTLFNELAKRADMVHECSIGEKQRDELLNSLKDVRLLKLGKGGMYTEDLRGYSSWDDVKDHARDGKDPQLSSFCNLLDQFEEGQLRDLVMRSARTEAEARISLTTAHRSKGQQWDHVLISDDFTTRMQRMLEPDHGSDAQDARQDDLEEETRLFYVAITRAKKQVQVPDFMRDYFAIDRRAQASSATRPSITSTAYAAPSFSLRNPVIHDPKQKIGTSSTHASFPDWREHDPRAFSGPAPSRDWRENRFINHGLTPDEIKKKNDTLRIKDLAIRTSMKRPSEDNDKPRKELRSIRCRCSVALNFQTIWAEGTKAVRHLAGSNCEMVGPGTNPNPQRLLRCRSCKALHELERPVSAAPS